MGWEKRGGKYYYYSKKRVNGRVRSTYVGRGVFAELGVRLIQHEQLKRKTEREALRCAQRADAEIDRQLARAEIAIYAMTNAQLYADGYHKHKGQWRKRRESKSKPTANA